MEATDASRTLVFIVGPTGSGKTDLSIRVAKHFGAPIISADSRQFFKGMPIGTAQPTSGQLDEVEHHFIASHEITDYYNCGKYEADALQLLDKLFHEHPVVVAVGGSGLYVDALCEGMDNLPDIDPGIRAELMERLAANGLEDLLCELRERDPEYYEQVDRSNPNRIVRALEVCRQTGLPYSLLRKGEKQKRDFKIIKIGTMLPRDVLYDRINRRVDIMVESGLEKEARALYPMRRLNALQTVGYRELFEYFDDVTTREEAIELIKRNSRRYAKRQMTWFGRDESIRWFDPADVAGVIGYIEEKTALE